MTTRGQDGDAGIGRRRLDWTSIPFHPFLVAAYPIVFLFAINADEQVTIDPLWPPLAMIPRFTSSLISSGAPGSSGATVISVATPRSNHATYSSGCGCRMRCSGCAPGFSFEKYGPSMCAPSTRAPVGGSSRNAFTASSVCVICSRVAVTVVSASEVVPPVAWYSQIARNASGVASMVSRRIAP